MAADPGRQGRPAETASTAYESSTQPRVTAEQLHRAFLHSTAAMPEAALDARPMQGRKGDHALQ